MTGYYISFDFASGCKKFSLMKLLQAFGTLLFAVVQASIPCYELPNNPTFEEYYENIVPCLECIDSEYPYTLVKMVLTLEKWRLIAGLKPCDEFSFLNVKEHEQFKYSPIMNELRDSFYSMNTHNRFDHISGLEVMFNVAFTILVRKIRKI